MVGAAIGELVAERPCESEGSRVNGLDVLRCEFFRTFTRFEYALKASGFHPQNRAAADWHSFAESPHVRRVLDDPVDAGLKEAIAYILDHPPNKQVIENGALTWSDRPPDAASQSGRVLGFVCRVRNNLFHGAKEDGFDIERTERLLRHSLAILHGCFGGLGACTQRVP